MLGLNYLLGVFGTTGYRPTAQDFTNLILFFNADISKFDAIIAGRVIDKLLNY